MDPRFNDDPAAAREELIQELEGPLIFRLLCLCGGLATVGFSVFSFFDVIHLLTSPTYFLIVIYSLLAGISTVIIEIKATRTAALRPISEAFLRWMPFLSIMLGKGLFYMMFGALTTSVWLTNMFLMCCGIYNTAMGAVLVVAHATKCSRLNAKLNMLSGEDAEAELELN
eukprot:GHVU01119474.1.p2 GENE.GHVU01119474.1~~GHVU01119474.1.p2  ORF type:complete len:170 (+),score=27.75 GHVU01119474.1:173-682(+)